MQKNKYGVVVGTFFFKMRSGRLTLVHVVYFDHIIFSY